MDNYKDIQGYEGYKINREGKVISYKRPNPRFLTPYIAGNGYWELTLSPKKGVYKSLGLHRILAETFLEKPEKAKVVNHKDGNTLNYDLDNLEWITQSENKMHAIYELKKRTATQRTIIVDGIEFESLRKCAEHFHINHKNLSSQLAKGIIPRALRGKELIVK